MENNIFTITLDKQYWETEEKWNISEYKIVINYKKFPRKTKKKMKKMLSYLIEKVK